jgi:hypothetical protein
MWALWQHLPLNFTSSLLAPSHFHWAETDGRDELNKAAEEQSVTTLVHPLFANDATKAKMAG